MISERSKIVIIEKKTSIIIKKIWKWGHNFVNIRKNVIYYDHASSMKLY